MLISAIRKFYRKLSRFPILNGSNEWEVPGNTLIKRKTLLLKFVSKFLIIALSIYGLFSIYIELYIHAIIVLSSAFILLLILVNFKKIRHYHQASKAITSVLVILTIFFFQRGDVSSGLYLWTLTTPLILTFFLKLGEGTIFSLLYLFVNILLTLINVFKTDYSGEFLIRYTVTYITIVIVSYIYRRIQAETNKGLESINLTLNKTIKKLSGTKQSLQQSESKYRALVENSNDGIGILRDFRFIYVNFKLSEMSGYEKNELMKKPLSYLIKAENKELLQRIFDNETWSGLPRNRIELKLKTKKGEVIEVEIGTNTIEYEDEQSQLIFIRDVRDRNLVEKERTKISNLESFRMVANGVTHDFNNILTIIMGNLELIKINRRGNPKLDKPLRKIEEASARATELLDDLYIFSTSAVKEESLENIKDLLGSVLQPLEAEFTMNKFELDFEDTLWSLRCDRKQICIALKNILLNSLDATEGEAKIKISVINFMNQSKVIHPLKERTYLQISIKDSGKGIPEENLGKIFDPYFSTKGNITEKGVGLGLAIANKIILDHQGLINVQSKSGSGTTFRIFLPAEIEK